MVQHANISPLAPKRQKKLPAIAGARLTTVATGVKYQGRDDLLMMTFAPGTTVAGVTTRSSMPSAAVDWCKANLPQGKAGALVVNAGNANAFTGRQGTRAVAAIGAYMAAKAGLPPAQVMMASTGVIGEDLDTGPICDGLDAGYDTLHEKGDWLAAAKAIMTTDTFPKTVTREVTLGGTKVRINGIAKGSGMIAPDMATMLGFFVTDADLPAPVLRKLLKDTVPGSFNAITVDSDTSTSDTVLLFATRTAKHRGGPVKSAGDKRLTAFRRALNEVMQDMAQLIVRDGEGATKFVTVKVRGAVSDASARRVALSIANSPLVKTAMAGEDANWGRIVMAVGKSGEPADRDRLGITIGGHKVAASGRAVKGYDERPVARHMRGREITLDVQLGVGRGAACVWTSDLTHDYISINADYRS
ncbi:MAG: bifunctional glutamate N-acetyltransferase/amino-acid acetyltransferase ArgJ [Parvibaculales bacterium]